VSTPDGPRSRTLASFRVLTDEVIERALASSANDLAADEIRCAALRAGAPVAREAPLAAAADLLGELSRGARLPPRWRALLGALIDGHEGEPTDSERAAAAWADATLEQRGAALWDLLLLADRIGTGRRGRPRRFPRLTSTEQ
jgi:hypothetical protein